MLQAAQQRCCSRGCPQQCTPSRHRYVLPSALGPRLPWLAQLACVGRRPQQPPCQLNSSILRICCPQDLRPDCRSTWRRLPADAGVAPYATSERSVASERSAFPSCRWIWKRPPSGQGGRWSGTASCGTRLPGRSPPPAKPAQTFTSTSATGCTTCGRQAPSVPIAHEPTVWRNLREASQHQRALRCTFQPPTDCPLKLINANVQWVRPPQARTASKAHTTLEIYNIGSRYILQVHLLVFVVRISWSGSLSQARNVPKEHAALEIYAMDSHRLAYYLDADEKLVPLIQRAVKRVRPSIRKNPGHDAHSLAAWRTVLDMDDEWCRASSQRSTASALWARSRGFPVHGMCMVSQHCTGGAPKHGRSKQFCPSLPGERHSLLWFRPFTSCLLAQELGHNIRQVRMANLL